MEKDINLISDKILELADLSLNFSKINRVTLHQDGKRPESDTDHTFMLSLLACSFANTFYKDKLDIGLVSQFATVHDLVEVYAGDTDTLVYNGENAKKIKEEKELESVQRIKKEFGLEFPWIHETIEKYESQYTKEARFIKIIDKILPKITGIFNNGIAIKRRKNKEEYRRFLEDQINSYKKYNEEFPELFLVFNEINKRSLDAF
ncbi:MAG: HD domain-containing protein [Candidatus Pacebacteria bacterium]|nr:HD domain-containing protein [Candidatus Paceibacterota bacterium]